MLWTFQWARYPWNGSGTNNATDESHPVSPSTLSPAYNPEHPHYSLLFCTLYSVYYSSVLCTHVSTALLDYPWRSFSSVFVIVTYLSSANFSFLLSLSSPSSCLYGQTPCYDFPMIPLWSYLLLVSIYSISFIDCSSFSFFLLKLRTSFLVLLPSWIHHLPCRIGTGSHSRQ